VYVLPARSFYNHSARCNGTFSIGLIHARRVEVDTEFTGLEGCTMNRYPSEQLMTVEEAERLSELHTGRNRRKQPVRQPSLWAWQSVSGALEQTVTEKEAVRLKTDPH